jgi:hypothetical protein
LDYEQALIALPQIHRASTERIARAGRTIRFA